MANERSDDRSQFIGREWLPENRDVGGQLNLHLDCGPLKVGQVNDRQIRQMLAPLMDQVDAREAFYSGVADQQVAHVK